jgi:16S rRNA (uracil1498-N3)-methyltransferase
VASLAGWLESLAAEPAQHRIVLSLEPSALDPERAFAAQATRSPGRDRPGAGRATVVVLSGPEGGLAPAEESAAIARGFVPVGLGPRVLRADTAPLALLAWLGLRASAAPGAQR